MWVRVGVMFELLLLASLCMLSERMNACGVDALLCVSNWMCACHGVRVVFVCV